MAGCLGALWYSLLTKDHYSFSMTLKTSPHLPFVALQHRDYRLLWTGQLISQTGSTMQSLTINWHISVLTNYNPLALGLVGLSRVIPIIIFSLIGGAVADARDRRKLMILTQSAMAIFAAVLAFLTDHGLDIVWPIYVLSAMSASAWAFDNPARQALIPSLVPREHLANAMSLNSIMFQTATIVGPTIAGFLIAGHSISIVYWINSLSFLAVIVALLFMHPVKVATRKVDLGSVREGIAFVRHQPIIWSTMTLDFIATFFSSASQLLPIFAAKILNVGAQGFGILEAAPAIGALLSGSTMSVVIMRIKRPGALILWSVALYGLATLAFGISTSFFLSLIFLGLTGIADNVSTILRSTIRQLVTPDHIRGRMTSVNMIFFMGGPQLGELEAGVVAALIGAPLSVITGGLGCLIAVALVAWKVPMLRKFDEDDLKRAGDVLTAGAAGK
jgi:MFS family permease